MSRVVLACLVGGILAISCDRGEDDEPTILPIGEAVDALDDAYCQRVVDCGCDEEWQPTPAECREQMETSIAAWREDGESHGLVYDGSCLGTMVDQLDDLGCDPPGDGNDEDAPDCVRPCNIYHGTARAGEACHRYDTFGDCAQGLECSVEICDAEDCTGTCRDPCRRAEIGERCDDVQCVEGATCDYTTGRCRSLGDEGDGCFDFGCREGLACDFENDRCVTLPSAGEPCFQGQCAEDFFCVTDPVDPTIQTCNAPGELDDPCMGHRQCESGYCPAGFCKELPGDGETCFGTCADGYSCSGVVDEMTVCEKAAPAVCQGNPI